MAISELRNQIGRGGGHKAQAYLYFYDMHLWDDIVRDLAADFDGLPHDINGIGSDLAFSF